MPSFDVVSELDSHEVTNAVDQANRELSQRFDFKDTGAVFELNGMTVAVKAQVEFQLKQMLEILKLRLAKRGIDVMCLEIKDPVVNLAAAVQDVILRQGVDARYRATDRAPDQGLEAQGAGQHAGREGAHHRQAARRTAIRHGPAAQGQGGDATAVQQFPRLKRLSAWRAPHRSARTGSRLHPARWAPGG